MFIVGDLVGKYIFHSTALVAVIGLMTGWMAISAVQEIMAETFRGFHDIRMATLFGGLATGGKSAGLIMRVMLLVCLLLLWATSGQADLRTVMLASSRLGRRERGPGRLVLAQEGLYPRYAGRGGSDKREGELRDAFPILLISLTSFVLLSAADLWILGDFRSKEEVGVYGAASRLVTLIAMPLLLTNLVLPPIIAEMYAQGRTNELERTLRGFSTLSGVPSLLVLIVFMLLGGPILGLVYGDELYGAPQSCAGAAQRRETRCRLGGVLRRGAPVHGPPGIYAARQPPDQPPLHSRGLACGARLRTDRNRQHDGRYHRVAERWRWCWSPRERPACGPT